MNLKRNSVGIYICFIAVTFCFIFSDISYASKCIQGHCRNGYGIKEHGPGRRYEGYFVHGKRNGQGKIIWDGRTYEGGWKDDEFHGKGIRIWESGARYEGEFLAGLRCGKGKMTWAQGAVYEGEYRDGKRNGNGTMMYVSGNRYAGEWKDDKCHGKGIFVYKSGDKYEGEFVAGFRHGKGKTTKTDGTIYEGEYRKGKLNGKGSAIYPNGNRYEGEWKDGNKNGFGAITYPDGRKFIGIFKNDPKGGTYTWHDHQKYFDQWKIEHEEKRKIVSHVKKLLESSQYEQLEEMAQKFRQSKGKFSNGGWKLSAFYGAFSDDWDDLKTEDEWRTRLELLKKWVEQTPASLTSHVALADFLTGYAWFGRGYKYAKEVTEEGWKLFHSRLNEAAKVLEECSRFHEKCPYWWEVSQSVALGMGMDREKYEKLFREAISFEPRYYPYYFGKAHYLLPRWHGEIGEWEAFAKESADQIGGRKGDVLYAQIVLSRDKYLSDKLDRVLINWDRVKYGFEVIRGTDTILKTVSYHFNEMLKKLKRFWIRLRNYVIRRWFLPDQHEQPRGKSKAVVEKVVPKEHGNIAWA